MDEMLRWINQFRAPEWHGCRTILVVTHERHIARLVEVNLQRAGKTVAVAYTLHEARKQLYESEGPRIVGVLVDAELVTGAGDSVTGFLDEARQTEGVRFVRTFGGPRFTTSRS